MRFARVGCEVGGVEQEGAARAALTLHFTRPYYTRGAPRLAVRRPLRPPLRRVFPIFLSAVRREIEEVVRREELVEAARVRGVRVIDIALVAYEYAVHRMVAFERFFREARSQ